MFFAAGVPFRNAVEGTPRQKTKFCSEGDDGGRRERRSARLVTGSGERCCYGGGLAQALRAVTRARRRPRRPPGGSPGSVFRRAETRTGRGVEWRSAERGGATPAARDCARWRNPAAVVAGIYVDQSGNVELQSPDFVGKTAGLVVPMKRRQPLLAVAGAELQNELDRSTGRIGEHCIRQLLPTPKRRQPILVNP